MCMEPVGVRLQSFRPSSSLLFGLLRFPHRLGLPLLQGDNLLGTWPECCIMGCGVFGVELVQDRQSLVLRSGRNLLGIDLLNVLAGQSHDDLTDWIGWGFWAAN